MRLLWQIGAKLRSVQFQNQIIIHYSKRLPIYNGPTVRTIRHLCHNSASGNGKKELEEESISEQGEQRKSQGVENFPDDDHLEAEGSPNRDSLNSAAHQATHRVSEKVTLSALERIADTLVGTAAKKVGSRAAEQTAAKAGERILEGVIGKATKQVGTAAARHAAESGVTKGLERAAEEVLPRAGKRATEAAFERGGMQAFGRGAEKTLPRAGEMGAVLAGEKIAEQAARHAANSGGIRRGLKTVLDRVLIRIGRGITIALPAVGSLFVLHLVKEDRKRALLEAEKGNMPAAHAFWLAFLCDASDLCAHVIIVTSLLNIHYDVGPHLPHTWLHTAEYGGLVVAVVSTLSAVVGELLSAGVSWPWRDNRSQKGSHPKDE